MFIYKSITYLSKQMYRITVIFNTYKQKILQFCLWPKYQAFVINCHENYRRENYLAFIKFSGNREPLKVLFVDQWRRGNERSFFIRINRIRKRKYFVSMLVNYSKIVSIKNISWVLLQNVNQCNELRYGIIRLCFQFCSQPRVQHKHLLHRKPFSISIRPVVWGYDRGDSNSENIQPKLTI
jgi:hypothetical protein